MRHNPRSESGHRRAEDWRGGRSEPDTRRGGRYQTGSDWDRYETGREQRYAPDWDRDYSARRPGFEGDRSYGAGGYAEEFGYRRDFTGRSPHSTGEFDPMRWREDEQGDQYYGTGTRYGGGFGTAPSSEASGAGSYGAPGYAGQGAWTDRYSDWLPESGGGRGTSGGYESYGSSVYGSQSSYGRDYGQSYASQDFGRRYGPQGYGEQPAGSEFRRHSFAGRGPKGYQRSDERLKEMICEQLTDDPRIDASDISIDVNQQIVRLSGSVEDRRTKYAAEELAERCGAKDVDNQLRVQART